MTRADYVKRISAAIGSRKFVWFGIRGHDAASLLELPQFEDSFAITAPLSAASLATDSTLEQHAGQRVDLDTYDIDLDRRPVVGDFRRELLASLNSDCVVATYRPSYFLSNAHFANFRTTTYLGLFKERQIAFEHKPWVETHLTDFGVRTVPWNYLAEERRDGIEAFLQDGPVVLRASRSSGGTGVILVESVDEIAERWDPREDMLIAVAPYLADAAPLNVGACVFPDGTITVHPGSFQLIGIPSCTDRRFGYCGNDLGVFAGLPEDVILEVDSMTRSVGKWMHSQGYVGAFGIDVLVQDGVVYFGEVNARFQGSTSLTCLACAELGEPDLLMDHLAAFLGVEPDERSVNRNLLEWARIMPPRAQVIVHNLSPTRARISDFARLLPDPRLDVLTELLPLDGSWVEPGGILARVVAPHPVTTTGFDLLPDVDDYVRQLSGGFTAEPE